MRTLLFALGLTSPIGFSQRQLAPVPEDPHELATSGARQLTTPAERGAVVSLLNRSAVNFAFHARGATPYILKSSFTAANAWSDQGQGQLEEDWANGQTWRWSTTVGGYSQLRVFSNGIAYDTVRAPMPMPVQLLRTAIFNPVRGVGINRQIRSVTASWKGAEVTCALFGGGENPGATGRHWTETEYCADPKTALLHIYSDAPGIYVVYDYAGATQFHGRTIPSKVSIFENGQNVMDAQITLTDGEFANSTLFTATEQMISSGPGAMVAAPERFPRFLPASASDASAQTAIQPTIVHAIIDAEGNVKEAIALQSTAVSAAALEAVKQSNFGRTAAPGNVRFQRQAFIDVRFIPGLVVSSSGIQDRNQ